MHMEYNKYWLVPYFIKRKTLTIAPSKYVGKSFMTLTHTSTLKDIMTIKEGIT
jgi:hypothetical protein